MPTYRASKNTASRVPALTPNASGDIMAATGEFIVPTGLAITDVIEFGILPGGCLPVDFTLITDDMDSNGMPTVIMNGGLLSGTPGDVNNARTCGADYLSASNVGQAGGLARANVATGFLATPSVSDRGFGVVLTTGAATLVVGAKMRATLYFQAAPYGIDAA